MWTKTTDTNYSRTPTSPILNKYNTQERTHERRPSTKSNTSKSSKSTEEGDDDEVREDACDDWGFHCFGDGERGVGVGAAIISNGSSCEETDSRSNSVSSQESSRPRRYSADDVDYLKHAMFVLDCEQDDAFNYDYSSSPPKLTVTVLSSVEGDGDGINNTKKDAAAAAAAACDDQTLDCGSDDGGSGSGGSGSSGGGSRSSASTIVPQTLSSTTTKSISATTSAPSLPHFSIPLSTASPIIHPPSAFSQVSRGSINKSHRSQSSSVSTTPEEEGKEVVATKKLDRAKETLLSAENLLFDLEL